MTGTDVSQALVEARTAGERLRERSPSEVVALLGRWLDVWSMEDSPWRGRLVRELPDATGFTPEVVAEGLRRALSPFGAKPLGELIERELGGMEALEGSGTLRVGGFDTTAVFLAGSLPTPTLLSVLAPLVLRSPVVVKPSAHDPVTARVAAETLAEIDPTLGDAVRVVPFPGTDGDAVAALLEADCIVATGSDETVAAVAARVGPARRLVTHGHRLSVALVGPEVDAEEVAEALALDVALWDQLGCLSPLAVYSVGGEERADRLAEALAGSLERAERSWPRGRVELGAAALRERERAEAELRCADGQGVAIHADPEGRWTVIREADARWRPAPLHRFVRVLPVVDNATRDRPWLQNHHPGGVRGLLEPVRRHLAGVALAGFGQETAAVARALADLGASRVCAPGTLQTPPLDWPHEGLGLLRPIAQFGQITA